METNNDFDPKQFIRDVEDHGKGLASLMERVKELEDKFGNNEKIAITLSDAAENAVKMQTMLEKRFLEMLCKNDNAKDAIKNLIDQWIETMLQFSGRDLVWLSGLS